MNTEPLDVTIVGGGMITQVQVLPSIYQLQRLGIVGTVNICALNSAPLQTLDKDPLLKKAFPGQSFTAYPALDTDPGEMFPDLFKEVVADMDPYNVMICALPDHLHYGCIKVGLENNQHILTVKPLCLEYGQGMELDEMGRERGLLIGIEYHKRFDDRNLIARRRYRAGEFGEFKAGQAHLVEPQYYRESNFQNWCTMENSDAFSYIACHYIDIVHFITGLLPTEVSVYGEVDPWPNGSKGFLWTDGRVIWENGAVLSVMNGFGYPDDGPGGNSQGMYLFTQGEGKGGVINHSDQYRGIKYGRVVKGSDPGECFYDETNPDYFQYLYKGGEGLVPAGYGYRSIEYIISQAARINSDTQGLGQEEAIEKRRDILQKLDEEGIMATPANSSFNELVMEAGRKSIMNSGKQVVIDYRDSPSVAFKEDFGLQK